MFIDDLKRVFKIGLFFENSDGGSKYGFGMKIVFFWFGDEWIIYIKKLSENIKSSLKLNLKFIV